VADTLHEANAPVKPTIYFPALSNSDQDETLVVRTDADPLAFSIPVQRQIAALDPELPVTNVLTVRQIVEESLGNVSLIATLVLVFAALSLALASVGLYGILSYLMTQRTTEIGIRIARGARRQQVLRLMLLDGLQPVLDRFGGERRRHSSDSVHALWRETDRSGGVRFSRRHPFAGGSVCLFAASLAGSET
jgi:hypothetical protein